MQVVKDMYRSDDYKNDLAESPDKKRINTDNSDSEIESVIIDTDEGDDGDGGDKKANKYDTFFRTDSKI